ncbi:diaminopimelate decarboxylase [Streptomyces platensis]|uniref:diaminopimelate decarboxylase n=1 Tax=Streptomyces platensis TaxID=58346 RepID=UPI001F40E13C|nr:diaminopimelate decarboxylase [Streptomyces platensis]MCF3142724.1 diaminopimelate decarboxylase [Streptomyces platensis]
MKESPLTLDCRGLTPALTVLRIKQALSSGPASDSPPVVLLGTECTPEQVVDALGEAAERIRYVPPDPGAHPAAVAPGDAPAAAAAPWWQRRDLCYDDGRLHLGGVDMADLTTRVGTPAYVCRADRVGENIQRLAGAMSSAGIDHRIYYAIKANRSPSLLSYLRARGLCGADVCSTGELMHALGCGFSADAISFTGTSLSVKDIEVLARFPDLRVNLDSLSALNSFGRACPGREVGLRINPAIGVGYQGDPRLSYSGAPTTKFGIYLEHLEEAKATAERWGLRIVRIHFHVGCGYLDAQLDQLQDALDAANALTEHLADLTEINIGGGLGVPHTSSDRPLDLERWATAIARRFAGRGLRVSVEPGDYLVKDAGLLLTTVTYVERRRDVLFAGLDAGFNLAMEPAFYGLPCEPVAVAPRWDEGTETYTVVGNINEALDKWAVDHRMTRLREGDRVALLNSGGYAASMRSEHCLRGQAGEVLLID